MILVLCLVVAPQAARADAQEQLDLATTRYQHGKFEEAADILGKLLSIAVDSDTAEGRARRRVYLKARPVYVAALLELGDRERAREVALEQYRDDPFYELPSGQFPPPVADLFIEVEAANRDAIERWQQEVIADKQDVAAERAEIAKAKAERLRKLEEMAAERVRIVERSRWIAAIPFGVGQFQNGDAGLGTFFAVSEALTVGGAIATSIAAFDTNETFVENCRPQREDVRCGALESRFEAIQIANWTTLGTSAALFVAGIIEAQVSFSGDEVVREPREIPPPVQPEAVVTEEGAYFGLRGHF